MNANSQELEHKEQLGNVMSVFIGMIIGGMVGAVTMLLFAPQSGEKTRADLQSKANQLKVEMQIKTQDLGHQGQDLIVRQLDHVSQAAVAGKKAIQGPANHVVV